MTSADVFNSGIGQWLEALKEPWNRLRYVVIQHNLRRHFAGGKLNILDIGGGSGADAIPLALQGHHVTLLDFSNAMLEQAQQNAIAANVAQNITLVTGSIEEMPTLFPEARFDAVLCHNVLQYVEDMPAAIRLLCAPLKTDGIVSVVSINRYSETYQQALFWHDLEKAQAMLDAEESQTMTFNAPVRRYAGEDVANALSDAGCPMLAHYGIRCVTDYISDNQLKLDPNTYQQLEQLELAMTDRYPYYLLARFFQIVGRKAGEPS